MHKKALMDFPERDRSFVSSGKEIGPTAPIRGAPDGSASGGARRRSRPKPRVRIGALGQS
jgi:hypothetical protein